VRAFCFFLELFMKSCVLVGGPGVRAFVFFELFNEVVRV